MKNRLKNEKRARFENIAAKRVQRIIDMLDGLSKCSNRNNYEYTEKDVRKMFTHIRKKVKETEMLFTSNGKKGNYQFKF